MFDKRRQEQPDIDDFTNALGLLSPDAMINNCFEPEDQEDFEDDEPQVWYRDDDGYSAKPYNRCSFIFHPSYWDTYCDLKQIDPQYAEIYIEALMRFGVDRFDEVPDIPVIKMALRGPFITIDKAFTNYVTKRREAAQEKSKEIQARQTAKQIKDAVRIMGTRQIEWEKRIKREWPYFYDR